MLLLECAICGGKKSRFIKEQEASELLSSLVIKTPLNKIPLLGDILFSLFWLISCYDIFSIKEWNGQQIFICRK